MLSTIVTIIVFCQRNLTLSLKPPVVYNNNALVNPSKLMVFENPAFSSLCHYLLLLLLLLLSLLSLFFVIIIIIIIFIIIIIVVITFTIFSKHLKESDLDRE